MLISVAHLGRAYLLVVDEVGAAVVAHLKVHRRRVNVHVAVILRLEAQLLGLWRTRHRTCQSHRVLLRHSSPIKTHTEFYYF